MNKPTDCKSRFCYNYTPPGNTETCCVPPVCATNERLALIASLPPVVNNSSKTTERSLLLQLQQKYLIDASKTQRDIAIVNTIQNSASITSDIQSQLLELKQQRYNPYQPYIYPVIPQSVMELQMNTANAGVPQSFFTIANCKGVQSVTT